MFEQLRNAKNEALAAFATRVRGLPPKKSPRTVLDWERACTAIEAFAARRPATVTSNLAAHIPEISRYSFHEPAG
jgi:hypothetical protein